MENEAELDTDELMHLALRASEQNQTEQAITYLKRAIHQDPDHGQAHYLLGALHAEIGLYDRAIAEMSQAVSLDPSVPTAHFQLGLLYITAGQVAEAETAWAALDELGEQDPLYLFKCGLLHLAYDRFEECIADLENGIQHNASNEALNNDMRRILDQAKTTLEQAPPADSGSEESDDENTGQNVLLSAYQRNEYDQEH